MESNIQTILISDDEESDMLCDEEENTSKGNDSVIVISDDNNSDSSLSYDNFVPDSSVSHSDSESGYIRITNRPGPKSKTRLKRPCKNALSESIKKKTCIPSELIECDTDISSDNDTDANICSDRVVNDICLDTSNECEENDDNVENKKAFVSDISQEKDLENKTNDFENKDDGDNHDSDKLICPNKCDTHISGENGSKIKVDLSNKNIITDISMLNKIILETSNELENKNEKNN